MRNRLRALWQHLLADDSTPEVLAASVFAGVFLGVVPLYGVQTWLCLLVAWALGLNRLTVIASAQVSLPMFAPFLLIGSVFLGDLMRYGRARVPSMGDVQAMEWAALWSGHVPDVIVSCFVGSVALGALLGAVAAGVVYAVARRRQQARGGRA